MMIAVIPKGVYNMSNRYVIINENAKKYQKSAKKIKSQLLEELTPTLHMNRQYLASLLRNSGKKVFKRGNAVVVAYPTLRELSKRGRRSVYGRDVEEALSVIWPLTGFASSKHLVAFIRLNWEMLFKHEKLSLISPTSSLGT